MVLAVKRPCTPILEQLADSSTAAAAARLRIVSAEGLPSWTAEITWLDDPYDVPGEPSNNKVFSTIKVEVIPAELL